MKFDLQIIRLMDSVENHGHRLLRRDTFKHPMGKLHQFEVHSTEPGKAPNHFQAMVIEFEDGGYDLYLPVKSNKITADVEAICGLPEGEGTLVD